MQPRYLALFSDDIDWLPFCWATEHTVVPCLCTVTLNSIVTPRHCRRPYCLEGYLGTNAFWCILGLRYLHHKTEKERKQKVDFKSISSFCMYVSVCANKKQRRRIWVWVRSQDKAGSQPYLLQRRRLYSCPLSAFPYLLSDSSAILRANISASSIFCSMSRRSSLPRMAVTLMRCISVSASAAFWASSLASSSAIWAFSASRSAVCSERSWTGRERVRGQQWQTEKRMK